MKTANIDPQAAGELRTKIWRDIVEAMASHQSAALNLTGSELSAVDFFLDTLLRGVAQTITNASDNEHADPIAMIALGMYLAECRRRKAIAENVHLTPERAQ